MKKIEIFGDDYCKECEKSRTACRGIVLHENKILMSYESVTDQWMIPGGGIEEGEDERDCCAREIEEETGIRVEPLECVLQIDEYYGNVKWVNKYFLCKFVGKTEMKLTEAEKEVGMEPRWALLEDIVRIFSKHEDYKESNAFKQGMYYREYLALEQLRQAIDWKQKGVHDERNNTAE